MARENMSNTQKSEDRSDSPAAPAAPAECCKWIEHIDGFSLCYSRLSFAYCSFHHHPRMATGYIWARGYVTVSKEDCWCSACFYRTSNYCHSILFSINFSAVHSISGALILVCRWHWHCWLNDIIVRISASLAVFGWAMDKKWPSHSSLSHHSHVTTISLFFFFFFFLSVGIPLICWIKKTFLFFRNFFSFHPENHNAE